MQRPFSSKPSSVLAMVDQAFGGVDRKTDNLLKMRTIIPNYSNPERTSTIVHYTNTIQHNTRAKYNQKERT